MAPWATAADARTAELWPDAGDVSEGFLELLLEAAQETCEAYAPALAADAPVPARYRIAVVMHARDVWNASRRNPEGTMGPEDYAVQVRPLSLDVRQLLRPRDPRPVFGTGRSVTA